MPDALPAFRYHPDPMATGAVIESTATCRCCDRPRGFVYVGPVYAEEELDDELCPWCIADGSAAATFGASFADVGWGVPDDVPANVVDEISERTPAFTSWQDPHWLYHCGDGAAFVGPAGYEDVRDHEVAVAMLEAEIHDLTVLAADGDATAYLFRCLHCGTHLAYADFS